MGESQRIIFVKNLNQIMKSRGIDQRDIVTALGVSTSIVSDWVTGKKYPRVDVMQRLSDFLGVYLSDLTADHSDDAESTLTLVPVETELLTIFRSLNTRGQDMLITTARGYAKDETLKKAGPSNTETA